MFLSGKKIIVAGAADTAAKISQLLELQGGRAFSVVIIETKRVDLNTDIKNVFSRISTFDWLVFTSKNGVVAFFDLMMAYDKTFAMPAKIKIAVIGQKTAEALNDYGCVAHFVNTGNNSDDFIESFDSAIDASSQRILLALGCLATDKIQSFFARRHHVERIDVYENTKPREINLNIIEKNLENNFDFCIFTSPSAFTNFVETLRIVPENINFKIASIGTITKAAIEQSGFIVDVVAKKSTAEGLVDAIINHYKK